ncbi:hypothetical protein BGZ51_000138 [Haplosporangium sp. Z 767]|nr:hypothetical protein BGZ51_000138 [Haplosporangium sp. Z 767]
MTYNFDSSSFSLDQAGLELSLNDFSFDPAQASQVQQRLQQQEQRQQQQQFQQQNHQRLQKLLLRDDPSQSIVIENQAQSQQSMNESASNAVSGAYTFRPTLAVDMMNPASVSASTTPVFQTHPDKVNNGGGLVGQSIQHQIQQQHRQQQLLLQQQQQRQQQQLLMQQQQQLQQFPHSQAQVPKEGARSQLLTPAGSEYYATDYSQYMSPLGIQPATTATETTVIMADQFEEEEVQFTPLISPAITPAHPYPNVPHPISTSNEIFSPLTSPALQPHRTSQIDYVSFSGQSFSSLPMQFQQAHQAQQQQMQQQLQQFQSQSQSQSQTQAQTQPQSDPSQALQQQPQFQQQQQQQNELMQQQLQTNPGIGAKHARVDTQSSSLMGQRPSMKRRTTVERTAGGLIPALPRSTGGPIRNALPKSSPALRPLVSHPISPATARKSTTGTGRPRSASAAAPISPMVMHFPGNGQPTPSPILTSTSQNGTPSYPQSQPSPSPHLVSNMNQLSMMPPSPALFALPASSMIPLQGSSMTLPSQQSQSLVQTPRQLSISHPVQSQQQKQQPSQDNQQTVNQQQHLAPQASQPPSSAALLKSTGYVANVPLAPLAPSIPGSNGEATADDNGSIPPTPSPAGSGSSKSSLAPVTPASLMNMSGSESTPTSSPKFGANTKARSLLTKSNQGSSEKSKGSKSNSSSSNSTSGSRRGGAKRHSHGVITTAGTLAPRTPGATAILAMPPPSGGFTLISPALKPTLMPQPSLHRGSIGGQAVLMSPRVQPTLVSPSLKPWLPGVSTTEAMARLASKSNYQNILDGDHTALGLSYNTDLHSGIELRRTSHKAAEQKRRDSLKHCFEDLRQMIPNIVDKAPSKVFLLKKSFDYICSLKSDLAQQDLVRAKIQAQEAYRLQALEAWMATLPENIPRPDMDLWKMSDEDLAKATAKEAAAARTAAEIAELSAAAVEAARVGNQPGGNKDGKSSNANGEKSGGSPGSAKGSAHSTGQGQSANANNNGHDGRGNVDDDDEESDDDDAPASVPNAASATNGSEPRSKANPKNIADPMSAGLRTAANGPTRRKARSHSGKRGQSSEEGVDQEDDDEEEEEEEEEEDDEDYDNEQGAIQDQEMTDVSDRPV